MARIIFAIVALLVSAIMLGFCTDSKPDPAAEEKRQARAVISDCKDKMADTLLSASTREAYRGMCNGLRNTYVTRYGTEP